MKQIRVFISDIDGCIAEPHEAYDLEAVQDLARAVGRAEQAGSAGGDANLPRFSLCSGRAYSYVEAVTQMLNVRIPVLFESGGGMFSLPAARIDWNPVFSDDIHRGLEEARDWLSSQLEPGGSARLDFGKRTQVGVISNDRHEIQRLVKAAESIIPNRWPHLKVYHTHVSVDVLPDGVEKSLAVQWLAEHLDITTEEMAFIGDTNGDIQALRLVGRSYAPANAVDTVKAEVDVVTVQSGIRGVIEAYRDSVYHNQSVVPSTGTEH